MPTPDFAVDAVVVEALSRLRVTTSVPADAVDACDPNDPMNPGCWVLSAGSDPAPADAAPTVCRVEPWLADPTDTVSTTPIAFLLHLDAPLDPGAAYALALSPTARAASSVATDTTPVAFVAPAYQGIAAQPAGVQGGDIADPPMASGGGDLALVDQNEALRGRVLRIISARRGAYTHLPEVGRSVEPKRTYSPAELKIEAGALQAAIASGLSDDIREATVTPTKGAAGPNALRFDIVVVPRKSPRPVVLNDVDLGPGASP